MLSRLCANYSKKSVRISWIFLFVFNINMFITQTLSPSFDFPPDYDLFSMMLWTWNLARSSGIPLIDGLLLFTFQKYFNLKDKYDKIKEFTRHWQYVVICTVVLLELATFIAMLVFKSLAFAQIWNACASYYIACHHSEVQESGFFNIFYFMSALAIAVLSRFISEEVSCIVYTLCLSFLFLTIILSICMDEDKVAESTRWKLETARNESDLINEAIMDYRRLESDLSDEVFEEEFAPSPANSLYNPYDSISIPMAPIAPIEYFADVPAFPFQDFQVRKKLEPEGNPSWRMANLFSSAQGTTFSSKYGKDYSNETRKALFDELSFLRTLPHHPNCVRFDGIVIGKWENVPYQIIGLSMENCRGGSLRQYIISVGSVLRRQVISTPNQLPPTLAPGNIPMEEIHNVDGSPSPPSSGYDSFSSKDRHTPDNQIVDPSHHFARVSARFCQFAEQISSALEHLHRAGIVHTRVTTISVYLQREFTDPLDMLCDQMVKLGDFGHAARSAEDVVVDQSLQSPEVTLEKRYEAKGDIWQFGTCLAEMCSLGVSYQTQKQIPLSGLEEFDKLPSTCVLQDAAKKCLTPRNRPSASDLRGVFQTDTARDMKALDMADQMKQSLLI